MKSLVPLPWFCSHTRKNLTLKYYAKKILYFLRQQNILKSLKSFLERPADQQSPLEGVAWKQTQPKLHCTLIWWWRLNWDCLHSSCPRKCINMQSPPLSFDQPSPLLDMLCRCCAGGSILQPVGRYNTEQHISPVGWNCRESEEDAEIKESLSPHPTRHSGWSFQTSLCIFHFMLFFSRWRFHGCGSGDCSEVEDFELQRQVMCSLNSVLYEQLQYKGNECDYYNPLNSYIHQVGLLSILHHFVRNASFSVQHPNLHLVWFPAGATTAYRYSHQPLCPVHDISPETGCSAGACQLSQPFPVTLVPKTTGVCL